MPTGDNGDNGHDTVALGMRDNHDFKYGNSSQDQSEKCCFINLPVEILQNIVLLVASPKTETEFSEKKVKVSYPEESFRLNRVQCGGSFTDLVALSATCSKLRMMVGPFLFQYLSLIRKNQIDVVLESPREFQRFSDKRKYQRELLKEVLEVGFKECAQADLAKSSFKDGLIGDKGAFSHYQKQFSMNNFVSYLECDNSILKSDHISLFNNISSLKVLDEAIKMPISAVKYDQLPQNLKSLAVNAVTFINLLPYRQLLTVLRRIDILCDLNEFTTEDMSRLSQALGTQKNSLETINLFFNDPVVVTYSEVGALFSSISQGCNRLKDISVRIIKRKSFQKYDIEWNALLERKDLILLNFLYPLDNLSHLSHITFDIGILNAFPLTDVNELFDTLHAGNRWQNRDKQLCITLIDHSLSTPELPVRLSNLFKFVVLFLGATMLEFRYGEVVVQSHIQAQSVVTKIVNSLTSSPISNTCPIDAVCLEKCWSVSDDLIRRDRYHRLLEEGNHTPQSPSQPNYHSRIITEMKTAYPWDRSALNSPHYRVHEMFRTQNHSLPGNNHCIYLAPVSHSSLPSLHRCCALTSRFWSTQSSLMELEQYSLKRKPLSSIWS